MSNPGLGTGRRQSKKEASNMSTRILIPSLRAFAVGAIGCALTAFTVTPAAAGPPLPWSPAGPATHISVPVPSAPMGDLIVVDVSPSHVRLRGSSPVASDTFFVSIAASTSDALSPVTMVRFPFLAHKGYYSLGGLTPGMEYKVRVWALVGRSRLLIGAVTFETPEIGTMMVPVPSPAP